MVVEPVDPFEGSELDVLGRGPGGAPVDDLGLVEAIDGLGQGVVEGIANGADRRLDAGLGQSAGSSNGPSPG